MIVRRFRKTHYTRTYRKVRIRTFCGARRPGPLWVEISDLKFSKSVTTRPRSLRTTLARAIKASKALSYMAACDFESACMDGDFVTADRIRDREMRNWIRTLGHHNAARINRPIAHF